LFSHNTSRFLRYYALFTIHDLQIKNSPVILSP
jgi:hypothetical protein